MERSFLDNQNNFKIKDVFLSNSFLYSIVASCATALPLFVDVLLMTMLSNHIKKPVKHSYAKLLPILAILLPDAIILGIARNAANCRVLPAIYCVRMLLLFISSMVLIQIFNKTPTWGRLILNLAAALFSIGQISSSLSAFSYSNEVFHIYYGIKVGCQITCLFIIIWQFLLWIRHDKTIGLIRNGSLEFYFVVAVHILLILGCALDTIFGYVPLYDRNASYFTAVTYTTSIIVVLLLGMYDYVLLLTLTAAQITERNEAKMEFLRYLCNHLRIPITNVSIGLTFVNNEIKHFSNHDMVDTVHQAVRSCESTVQILDNILLYDKLHSDDVRLFIKNVGFSEFIKKTIRPFLAQAQDKFIAIKDNIVNVAKLNTHLVYVTADSNRLCQIIRTLLVNALSFTKARGTVTLTLEYRCVVTDSVLRAEAVARGTSVGTLVFSVEDTGCGIPPERLESIFEENLRIVPVKTAQSPSSLAGRSQGQSGQGQGATSRGQGILRQERDKGDIWRFNSERIFPKIPFNLSLKSPTILASMSNAFAESDVIKEARQIPKGLGLWIAKRLVELHPDCDLQAFSRGVNMGSKFTLSMPFYLSNGEHFEQGVFDRVEPTTSFRLAQQLFEYRPVMSDQQSYGDLPRDIEDDGAACSDVPAAVMKLDTKASEPSSRSRTKVACEEV